MKSSTDRPLISNPGPETARTHSDKQLAKLKASIQTFGFTAPVLVDEAGVILSGHGRVQAAKALGLAQIPTRVLSGLSEVKKRAYVIADNKIAQLPGGTRPYSSRSWKSSSTRGLRLR